MAIDFGNCEILGYSHQNEFLGETTMRYKSVKSLSIEGYVTDLRRSEGVSGVWSGLQALEVSADDWTDIVLRNTSFGSGKITSINFSEGNDVKYKRYSVDVDIFELGNINNFCNTGVYLGINYTNFNYLTSLNESLSYTNNFDTEEYSHSIDLSVLSSNSGNSIGIARNIATNLYNSSNILNVLGLYGSLSGKKVIYSEDHDDLNVSYSFNKSIILYKNSSGNYTINKNYVYTREENGVISVSEKGDIRALEEPYMDVLSSAFQSASGLTFINCQEIYDGYNSEDAYVLQNTPITKGVSIDRFAQVLNYEFVYSNNLNINSGMFFDYTHDCSLNEKGLVESNEEGNIVGFGHISDEKFNSAKLGYDSIKNQITGRTKDAYDRFRHFNSDLTNTNIFLINKDETFSIYNGQIKYKYNFLNDQNMLTGVLNLTRAQLVVKEGFRVPITQLFNIINHGELEQVSEADDVAERSVDITINGTRQATLSDYINYTKNIVAPYAGDFITSAQYSLNPFTNDFKATITFAKIYE